MPDRPLFTEYTAHYFFPGLRVQWIKSRARSQHWAEEVLLLKEEMHRVLAYLDHKASHWTILATSYGCTVSSQLDEGLHAYAKKQAQLLQDMAQSFEMKWAIL